MFGTNMLKEKNKIVLHDHTQQRLQFIKDDASGGENNSKQATKSKSNKDTVSKKCTGKTQGKSTKGNS